MLPKALKAKMLAKAVSGLVMALTLLMTACGDISTPTVATPSTRPAEVGSAGPTTKPSNSVTTTAPVTSLAPVVTPVTTVIPPSNTVVITTLAATASTSSATPSTSVPDWDITTPLAPDEKEVTFTAGKDRLYATLLIPNDGKTGKKPAVLIVPGGGPFDRNGSGDPKMFPAQFNTYLELTRVLANQGVVSLRYDKITTGKTGLGSYASHPKDVNYPL